MLEKIYLPNSKNQKLFFPYLKGKKTYSFKSGINGIIGPNASGKTILLNTFRLRNSFEAKGLWETISIPTYADSEYRYKVMVTESNQADKIIWYDPRQYSRFNEKGIKEVFSKNIEDGVALSIFRGSEAECNALYFKHWFEKHKDIISTQPIIICMDEIENSNDPFTILTMMKTFQSWCQVNPRVQILIATHSPMVLHYADHIIELKKGYANEVRDIFLKILNS